MKSAAASSSVRTFWEEAHAQVLSAGSREMKLESLAPLASHYSVEEIERLVIPKRTLARRRANKEALSPEEADKALRLARIGAEADRVFGDPAKAARWLRKRTSALNMRAPIDLLESETGAYAVDELLGQIDHGMFS
jgi:putative toxin-antitoxin system antitoxin component (TIGR02293 family)